MLEFGAEVVIFFGKNKPLSNMSTKGAAANIRVGGGLGNP
jgi:hypothetical protein